VTCAPVDEELVRRLRHGDEEAFVGLYRREGPAVFRFAMAMTGSRTLAEDVTQETFLALIEGFSRFDLARGSLAAYVKGTARHLLHRRLTTERRFVPLPDAHEESSATSAGGDDPLEGLERRQRVGRVHRALLTLPLHYREAVALCDLEGLDYAEAATTLRCSVGTVRSRLSRGRELLARKLRASEEPLGHSKARLVLGL
jgi:RNA polymerase sigma-70 factor, ECF subfamily